MSKILFLSTHNAAQTVYKSTCNLKIEINDNSPFMLIQYITKAVAPSGVTLSTPSVSG